ncbi:MAG: Calx-beta domain-containing protein, partial [Flavobacteriaceae bacterium]
ISVQTIDDVVLESNETFYVDLSNATNGVGIADPQGVVSITDNDSASIAISDTVVTEGNSAVVNVTLTNAVSGGFSVDYSTVGSSATAAIDFVVNSGTLNFNGTSGETQSITVVTNDDSVVENTESFFVNLSGATSGVNISDNQAVVTISDNDTDPDSANITIDDVQINEGDNIVFTVTLDSSVNGGFTVNYNTSDVSAVEGEDFVGINGSLTFAGVAGETQTIIILSLDDTEIEATETFSVLLSNATNNVNIQDPQGTATILDNDSETEEPVEITISDGQAQEGGSIFFEVLLSRELPEDLLLFYEVINESASAEDYNLDVNSLLIRAGDTSGQIVVALLSDAVVEEDETFSIRLIDPAITIVRLADDIAVGTIIDSNSQQEEDIILSPVPLRNGSDLTVSRIVDGDYFMSLYTYTGQLIYQDQITVANNSYEIDLDDSLATGIFLLELTNVSAGIQYEELFVISR